MIHGQSWQMDKVEIGSATLYLADCAEILPKLGMFDAVVTDPPYGIDVLNKTYKNKNLKPGKSLATKREYDDLGGWDNKPITKENIELIRNISKWQIIFGGNYFELPPTKCWLIWDKETGDNDFADAELAWTNLNKAVRLKRYMWNGMLRANKEPRGDHPTQKPVGIMEWVISHLPENVESIIDPYMGSGTTGVACMNLQKKFIGIEREQKYFDIACKRIEDAQRQNRLF
jgi:site-specific DNA-methyltransferase (adenine-specific)/modification methylase